MINVSVEVILGMGEFDEEDIGEEEGEGTGGGEG